MDRLSTIRHEEKVYHEFIYEHHQLFKKGSWLYKPADTVMETMTYFNDFNELNVLDLGCGVGRHTIPIAEAMSEKTSQVIAVDLLPKALDKLMDYAQNYQVDEMITPVCQDIGEYKIVPETYDFIVAVSTLEHVQSESTLDSVLHSMAQGTKENGINCLIINTSVRERDMETDKELDALVEINISTDKMLKKVRTLYNGWEELKVLVKPLSYQIHRNHRSIMLETAALTFVARKPIKE